jgi:hypothetical protein
MSTGSDGSAEPQWRRRRRLDEVFGDVLPETTGDEREAERHPSGSGSGSDESAGERWLREQVPPHHGD